MTTNQPLDLDAIETAADAATPGPWGVYESGGLIDVAADLEDTGCGYRARRGIARLDEEPLDNDPTHREWTAEEDWAQVAADAEFIAAMSPEVAKALVDEVRRLRAERNRYRTAWRLARTRALSTGGAADRYAVRAREGQTALQDMFVALLAAQMERDEAQAEAAALKAVLAKAHTEDHPAARSAAV